MPLRDSFAYNLLKQSLELDITALDKKSISGRTVLTIVPTASLTEYGYLSIHARQMRIHEAFVNGISSPFKHIDQLQKVCLKPHYRDLSMFDVNYQQKLGAAKEGCLQVDLPEGIRPEKLPKSVSGVEYRPIEVEIHFSLIEPTGGFLFVDPLKQSTVRSTYPAHCYTVNSLGGVSGAHENCGGAQLWFPCVDELDVKAPFEFQCTLDSSLTLICGGNLVEEVPQELLRCSRFYSFPLPISAHMIGIAIGPFKSVPVKNDDKVGEVEQGWVSVAPGEMDVEEKEEEQVDGVPVVLHFLGGEENVSALRKVLQERTPSIFSFFETFFGCPCICKKYDIVVVESMDSDVEPFFGGCFLNAELVHKAKTAEDSRLLLRLIAQAICTCWIGCFASVKGWEDSWFQIGTSRFLANLYLKTLSSNDEELELQIAQLHRAVVALAASGETIPLSSAETTCDVLDPFAFLPPDRRALLEVKGALTLHVMMNHVGAELMRSLFMGIIRGAVWPLVEQSRKAGIEPEEWLPGGMQQFAVPPVVAQTRGRRKTEKSSAAFSVRSFMKELKNAAPDADKACQSVVYCAYLAFCTSDGRTAAGMFCFRAGIRYDEKQHGVILVLTQDVPDGGILFQGQITVQVMEPGGTYFHTYLVENMWHRWVLPLRGNPPRKRRRTEITTATSPFLFVRIDPAMTMLRTITFRQPEAMWISQLLHSGSVIAQQESLKALSELPLPAVQSFTARPCHSLFSAFKNTSASIHPSVRAEIPLAIAQWQNLHAPETVSSIGSKSSWAGLKLLLGELEDLRFVPDPAVEGAEVELFAAVMDNRGNTEVKQFRVENAWEKSMQTNLVKAIGAVRSADGDCPEIVILRLLALLENHSSEEFVDDSEYRAALIEALGSAVCGFVTANNWAFDDAEFSRWKIAKRAVAAIEHCLGLERRWPSSGLAVTNACLSALTGLKVTELRFRFAEREQRVLFEEQERRRIEAEREKPTEEGAVAIEEQLFVVRDSLFRPPHRSYPSPYSVESGAASEVMDVTTPAFSRSHLNLPVSALNDPVSLVLYGHIHPTFPAAIRKTAVQGLIRIGLWAPAECAMLHRIPRVVAYCEREKEEKVAQRESEMEVDHRSAFAGRGRDIVYDTTDECPFINSSRLFHFNTGVTRRLFGDHAVSSSSWYAVLNFCLAIAKFDKTRLRWVTLESLVKLHASWEKSWSCLAPTVPEKMIPMCRRFMSAFSPLHLGTSANQTICSTIWQLANEESATQWRLRNAARRLYSCVWGRGKPKIFGNIRLTEAFDQWPQSLTNLLSGEEMSETVPGATGMRYGKGYTRKESAADMGLTPIATGKKGRKYESRHSLLRIDDRNYVMVEAILSEKWLKNRTVKVKLGSSTPM